MRLASLDLWRCDGLAAALATASARLGYFAVPRGPQLVRLGPQPPGSEADGLAQCEAVSLRLLAAAARALGCSADDLVASATTHLFTYFQGSLELLVDGAWVTAETPPGCMIVQVGPALERASAGRWRPVPHRLAGLAQQVFFVMPPREPEWEVVA